MTLHHCPARPSTHTGTWGPARVALAGLLTAVLMLTGCASPGGPSTLTTTPGGVPIDTRYNSKGQDSRVLFLVLHYTVLDLPQSIKVLTEQEVSSHYLLSDETPPRIFRLVPEDQRAWHSGASAWKGHRMLNANSIGIEIVHPGFTPGPDGAPVFAPFSKTQIDALIPLVQDIVKRHQIRPERILGHGEVTPSYKVDPGPTFPWARLSELGITPKLPDPARVAEQRALFEATLPDIKWFQNALIQHGYLVEPTGLADPQTQRVLMNFQMRYRPSNYSGLADAESAALLQVLTAPAAPVAAAPRPPVATSKY
jgi:N-acetylmuramoyl-L-alanine amidase